MNIEKSGVSMFGAPVGGAQSADLVRLRLSELWPWYLAAAERKGEATLRADRTAWRRLTLFCGDCRALELTREQARDWVAEMIESGLDGISRGLYVASCRRILKLLEVFHTELVGAALPLAPGLEAEASGSRPPVALNSRGGWPELCWKVATDFMLSRNLQAGAAKLSDMWDLYKCLNSSMSKEWRKFKGDAWADLVAVAGDVPALELRAEHVAECLGRLSPKEWRRHHLTVWREVWNDTARRLGVGLAWKDTPISTFAIKLVAATDD